VFLNWDTTKPINKPELPKRTAEASSIPVGTLIDHGPVPVIGTDTHITGERCAHAEAFLNISVDENQNLNYHYTDARRNIVPSKMVQLREGLTMPTSFNMVADHYDEHERKRVRTFNEDLVIYWFRQYLVAKMEDGAAGSLELSQKKQDRDFDYDQLVQLNLDRDALDLLRNMAVDCERLKAISPLQFFRWESAKERM
jgi:hypothetical protein